MVKEPVIMKWNNIEGVLKTVSLAKIQRGQLRINGENPAHVAKLAERYAAKDTIDPIIVVMTAEGPRCLDGHHRLEAMKQTGMSRAQVLILPGGEEMAAFYCLQVNQVETEKMTNADKEAVVRNALLDPVARKLADKTIGKLSKVSHTTVTEMRKQLVAEGVIPNEPTSAYYRKGQLIVRVREKAKAGEKAPRASRKPGKKAKAGEACDAAATLPQVPGEVMQAPAIMEADGTSDQTVECAKADDQPGTTSSHPAEEPSQPEYTPVTVNDEFAQPTPTITAVPDKSATSAVVTPVPQKQLPASNTDNTSLAATSKRMETSPSDTMAATPILTGATAGKIPAPSHIGAARDKAANGRKLQQVRHPGTPAAARPTPLQVISTIALSVVSVFSLLRLK